MSARAALTLLALVLLAAPGGAARAAPPLVPVDEAARDASFFLFRARLAAAVAARDTAAVYAALDPAIRNTMGDDNGLDGFRRQWRPADPDSPLWRELGAVLALGGAFHDDTTFVAPYVFARWPDALDAYEHVAIVGSDVRVRAAPRPDAAVIAKLGFEVVPVPLPPPAEAPAGWTCVRLPGGRTGWVASAYVRLPLDWRAIFARRPAGWRLVTLVAGD